jgi:hypothetical protein
VNPRTRRAALYAIAVIAILASANALAHSYAGLYAWAVHHRLTGWQAMSWPAEIDVFLAVGELALYVAYLDGWPARQRVWPWATALTGLAVSVAGNIGHIRPEPGHPVLLVDRLTAATSPLAAFAGLTVGLLVLRMNRQKATAVRPAEEAPFEREALEVTGNGTCAVPDGESPLLRDAALIYRTAAERGERLSQRALARSLRGQGHRFPNQSLHSIAAAIGLAAAPAQIPEPGR